MIYILFFSIIFDVDSLQVIKFNQAMPVQLTLFPQEILASYSQTGLSVKKHGNLGKELSENHKYKLSVAHKGKKHSEATIEKMSIVHKGFKHTEQTKKKLSIYWTGKKRQPHSEEWKRKISFMLKGKKPYIITENTRLKMSIAQKGHIAWNKGKEHVKIQKERHFNWKGGITPETQRRIQSIKWKQIRKQVYKRDNWICQVCGKHCQKKEIQCHHVIPYRITQDNSMDNLITLCSSCHMKEEWKIL